MTEQQYGAKAVNTISYNGHNYQYSGGDFSTSGTDFIISAPTTKTAHYKGIHLSNNINAYTNSSQRKIVKTSDNVMHTVYESLGRVWYEISTDNGSNWQLMNSAQPLDNGAGKLPSIDYYGNEIAIVFEQQDGSYYDVVLKTFYAYGNQYVPGFSSTVHTDGIESYSVDVNPVIGWGYNSKAMVVWEGKYYNGLTYTDCLVSKYGSVSYNNITWYDEKNVSGSDNISITPTIAVTKDYESTIYYQLAWMENTYYSNIYYCKLYGNGSNNIQSTSVINVSNGNGALTNKTPSVIAVPVGGARVNWVGVLSWTTFSYLKDPNSGSSNTLGYGVNSTNINNTDNHSAYYIGWSEGSGNTNKVVSNALSPIKNINTTGKYIEMSNGATPGKMYVSAFNIGSTPYYFTTSNSIGSYYGLSKTTSDQSVTISRGGVLAAGSYQYYYLLNGIKVDNLPIEFTDEEEDIKLENINQLNNYLVTKPFTVTSNSDFTYNFVTETFCTDSIKTVSNKDENVTFYLELIDAKTNEVIGQLDERNYSQESVSQGYARESYKVNTDGLTGKEVKLRIRITTATKPQFYLINSYWDSDENTLQKEAVKEISYQGSLKVNEYDLAQNYPNPFNPSTVIKYQLPKDGYVTLKIYDILGREIATLVNEFKSQGRYNATFNGSNFASGVYIYQLKAGDFVANKKLILMK